MTGRLPMHVQDTLANPDVAIAGIPVNMTALPLKLQEAGWSTHIAGKWDLGGATQHHMPTGRGFNSSLVYLEHMNFYYSHQICPTGTSCDMAKYAYLHDLWDTNGPAAPDPNDTYIEYLFHDRLSSVIDAHDLNAGPLYLHYTSHVVHWPLQVPQEYFDRVGYTPDDEDACKDNIPQVWPGANKSVISCRRQYHAMLLVLSDVVGNLTAQLKAKGWWNDTLMIVSSDNGGSISPGENAASNYPLRGGKYAPMEGGTRVSAFVSGGYLPPAVRGTTLTAPIHMADWYGTICGLVGVDPVDALANASVPQRPPVDSLDVWPLLSGANTTSPRVEIPIGKQALLQFDQAAGQAFKLYVGSFGNDMGWMGPVYPNASSPKSSPGDVGLQCPTGCLFEVMGDPTEHVDLASSQPDRVAAMQARLTQLSTDFYSNDDILTPVCAGNVTDCACEVAATTWGGYLGPWAV